MAGVKIVIVNALPDNIQMIHQSDETTVLLFPKQWSNDSQLAVAQYLFRCGCVHHTLYPMPCVPATE